MTLSLLIPCIWCRQPILETSKGAQPNFIRSDKRTLCKGTWICQRPCLWICTCMWVHTYIYIYMVNLLIPSWANDKSYNHEIKYSLWVRRGFRQHEFLALKRFSWPSALLRWSFLWLSAGLSISCQPHILLYLHIHITMCLHKADPLVASSSYYFHINTPLCINRSLTVSC